MAVRRLSGASDEGEETEREPESGTRIRVNVSAGYPRPGYDHADEFEYGLDLILDGLDRAKASS
jgi:hypothetical protein